SGVSQGRFEGGEELVFREQLGVLFLVRLGVAHFEDEGALFLVGAEHDGLDGGGSGGGGLLLFVLLSRDAAGGDEEEDGNNSRSISHVYPTLQERVPVGDVDHFRRPPEEHMCTLSFRPP